MRRVESLDPATELAWLKVVVKHEALAVRRGRAGVAGEEVDLDAVPAVAQRSVEERFESAERVERSAEVMRRLKRDEARALMLKAEGLSYDEIGERLGLDVHEGQPLHHRGPAAVHEALRGARDGRGVRAAGADAGGARGRAPRASDALLELRPHLRNCAGCRATVRQLHASRLRPAHGVPADRRGGRAGAGGGRAAARAGRGRSRRSSCGRWSQSEHVEEVFRRLNAGEPAVQPVAPSVAETATRRLVGAREPARLGRGGAPAAAELRRGAERARGDGGGGGRITSIAALIGVCVSGVGAGTYCVATALLPDPKPAIRAEAKPAQKRRPQREAKLARLPSPASEAARATPTAAPVRRSRPASHTSDPSAKAPRASTAPGASTDLAGAGGHTGLFVRADRRSRPGHAGGRTNDRRRGVRTRESPNRLL